MIVAAIVQKCHLHVREWVVVAASGWQRFHLKKREKLSQSFHFIANRPNLIPHQGKPSKCLRQQIQQKLKVKQMLTKVLKTVNYFYLF